MTHLLAIDVGTLSARAGVFDATGRLLAVHSASFALMHPAEHHAVYRMDEIWAAVCAATRGALAACPGPVAGIAIDAMSSTYVEASGPRPLDGDADVFCWMDHRGEREAEEIAATKDRYLAHVGGTLSPEMYLPKLLWLKRHRPETWARVTAVRDLSDEIARRATGLDRHSVCGLACKFPYLPGDAEPWRHGLLATIGLSELPRLGALNQRPGRVGEVHGPLSAEGGAAMGLPAGVPLAFGLIDAEAGALGSVGRDFRAHMNRTLALIGGTSTCYISFARDERPISGVWGPFKDAVFGGYWMHEAGQSYSGAALDAVLAQHPASPGKPGAQLHAQTAAEILEHLEREGPAFGSQRHILPDWLGNRAPLGDGAVRALATGLGLETGRRAFLGHYYATARALALQSRQIIEHMNRHGYEFSRVCLSGGHLKNPLLVKLYTDAMGVDLVICDSAEPVLLGTAVVAAMAAGLHGDLFAALDAMSPGASVRRADPRWARAHESAYQTYLKLFELRNQIEAAGRDMGRGWDH